MFKIKLSKILPFSMLLIAIFSIQMHAVVPLGNLYFWLALQIVILLIFWKTKKNFYIKEFGQNLITVKWYLMWVVLCFLRGVFVAENYWDYKALIVNTLGLLTPFMVYHFINLKFTYVFFRFYLKYTFPLFFVILFIIPPDAYGFYLIPISTLLLFFPGFGLKEKLILLIIAVFVSTADLTSRSNVIKFSFPLLFSFLYYFRNFLSRKVFEIARNFFFIIPFMLFLLAVSGYFNVFKMQDYIKGKGTYGEVKSKDLTVDSRTFIYLEVLNSALKHDIWWFGRTPARGNETTFFKSEDPAGRGERYRNEVAFLNLLTWTGVVGILLYFFIFYHASYLAINKSNNIFSQILGLFIAFRFVYAWVEDSNEFNLNYIILWLLFGLCFSKKFREMNDVEVKYWIRGLFNKKHSNIKE